MKEQIVSYKVAKLAKDKGFNEFCIGVYSDTGVEQHLLNISDPEEFMLEINIGNYDKAYKYISNTNSEMQDINDEIIGRAPKWNRGPHISAPTQSFLQKWLREKHNIVVFINPYPTTYAAVIQYNNREDKYATDLYDTYEEALEIGLEQALKLIDNGDKNKV